MSNTEQRVMSVPTIEEKAAAFDALCDEFRGKAKFIRFKRIETGSRSVPPFPTAHAEVRFCDVPIYEWVLRAEGDGGDDFAAVAIKMGKQR